MTYALNMNPRLDGGILPGQTENLYIDGQKRVWFVDEEIKCAPFQESTIIAPESALLQGFEQVNHHEYCESGEQGVFIYQKEDSNVSYTIRVLTINRQGIINHQDLTLDKKVLRYFVYDDQINLVLPDGILILDEDQNVTVRNSELLQDLEFRYRDHDSLVFAGPYRIVTVRFSKLGEAVDTFVKTSSTVTVNGKALPTYQVQGQQAICVEDLQHCGYEMTWDSVRRTTLFTYQENKPVDPDAQPELQVSQGTIYYSDIDVYINGVWYRTYNTGGYSLVELAKLPSIESQ